MNTDYRKIVEEYHQRKETVYLQNVASGSQNRENSKKRDISELLETIFNKSHSKCSLKRQHENISS